MNLIFPIVLAFTLLASPASVDQSRLSYHGQLAYSTYLRLHSDKSGWWWSEPRFVADDGNFDVSDFTALVLYMELDSWHTYPEFHSAWTEALGRSSVEWGRYSRSEIATGLDSDEGKLNWIFAQSGLSRLYPESFYRKEDSLPLLSAAIASLDSISSPELQWAEGCESLDRPCSVGANAPSLHLPLIHSFVSGGCQAYLLDGICGNPETSNFAFILTRRQSIELEKYGD